MAKHIFVTGGVVSSLGKGITMAMKATLTWVITSALSTKASRATPTSPKALSIKASSPASVAAISWVAPCRLFPM